jgi:uncharacterized protein YndB with AHSA1/START domain
MTTPETTFEAPENAHVMTMTAVIDAPVESVYRANVEVDLLTQWWGPRELTSKVDTFEPRVGGAWRIVHVDPDGNEYGFNGVFHVVTPTQIVKTFEFEGAPGHVNLQTTTLEEVDGKTKVTEQALFQTVFARDMMADTGARDFAPVGMAQLEEVAKSV